MKKKEPCPSCGYCPTCKRGPEFLWYRPYQPDPVRLRWGVTSPGGDTSNTYTITTGDSSNA